MVLYDHDYTREGIMAIESITYHGDGEFKSVFIGDSKLDNKSIIEKYRKVTTRFKTPIHIHLLNDNNKKYYMYNIDTSNGIHLGLYDNVNGYNSLPLTPWIIIHRSLHGLPDSMTTKMFMYEKIFIDGVIELNRNNLSILNKSKFISCNLTSFKKDEYRKIQMEIEEKVNNIDKLKWLSEYDDISMRLFHYVYTMKSARDSAISFIDRINECICQYIFTGKVTIRHPDTFPEGLVSKEVHDKLISMHEDFETQINDHCKNILEYIEKENILVCF